MAINNKKVKLEIKKTLLITVDFPPQMGGVANYLANLCNNFQPEKINVLANYHQDQQHFDSKQDYKIFRKNLYYKNFWPRWIKIYKIARNIIKNQQIEQILISHVIPLGYICLLLNKPFFVILHGYDIKLSQNTRWKRFWLKLILNRAQHIITNSNYTKKLVLDQGINESIISIIYPCPNITPTMLNQTEQDLIVKDLEIQGKRIILSVGRLVKRKGIDKVIESLPLVLEKIPNLIYLVIGNGKYREELELLAEKINVRGNLIFISDVPDSRLPCYYNIADIFIQPSRIENSTDVEGFGIVYLEANLFGKPVIAGDSGGVAEAVLNKQTGLIVNPLNVQQIAQALISLLSNHQLMNKLGIQGKVRVCNEFTWQKQVHKLKNIL